MIIKILGPGCKNCIALTENTKEALAELGIKAEIEKIADFAEIARYGVMSTPGLVFDDKLVSFGKVLKSRDIVKLLEKATQSH